MMALVRIFGFGLCLVSLSTTLATAQPATPANERTLDLGGGQQLVLRRIEHGRFVQGSPSTETGRGDDENQRTVTLSQDFWIGKTPVTVGQYRRFVEETGYRTESERGTSGGSGWDGTQLVQKPAFNWRNPGFAQTDQHPVTLVTFGDSIAFLDWLARKSNLYTALPTEAQWEYACRAGGSDATYDPKQPIGALAHIKSNSGTGTQPVGGKAPNDWALFDMLGNVNEWVLDFHGPYVAGPIVDPLEERQTLGDKPRRGLRGGSWLRDEKSARCAARYRNAPGSRNADNGFRVVAYEAPPASEAGIAPPVSTPSAPPLATGSNPSADAPSSTPLPVSQGSRLVNTCSNIGPLVGAILFFLIFFRIFRGASKKSTTTLAKDAKGQTWSGRVKLRPQADGFRILAPPSLKGGELSYSYRAGTQLKTGNVRLDPSIDGQVVFLGLRPTQLKMVSLRTPEGNVERYDGADDGDDGGGSYYNNDNYGPPSAY